MSFEKRSKDDLERLYVEALQRLINACRLYDEGHVSEAVDISKEVANFVYDKGATKSLLESLEMKATIRFVNSAKPAFVAQGGFKLMSNEYFLVTSRFGFHGMDFTPVGISASNQLDEFTDWWTGAVLSKHDPNTQGRVFITRAELVMHVRNKEGGGHISEGNHINTSTRKMVDLMSGAYVDGHIQINEGERMTAEDTAPAYATLRQIGWELVTTLMNARPDLYQRAVTPPPLGPRMKPVMR